MGKEISKISDRRGKRQCVQKWQLASINRETEEKLITTRADKRPKENRIESRRDKMTLINCINILQNSQTNITESKDAYRCYANYQLLLCRFQRNLEFGLRAMFNQSRTMTYLGKCQNTLLPNKK